MCYSLLSSLFFLLLKISRFGQWELFQLLTCLISIWAQHNILSSPYTYPTLDLESPIFSKEALQDFKLHSSKPFWQPHKIRSHVTLLRTAYRRPTKARKREMSHNISGLPIWVGFFAPLDTPCPNLYYPLIRVLIGLLSDILRFFSI